MVISNVRCDNPRTQIQEYKVTLTSESMFLLAESKEEAAWSALELAKERKSKLIDVVLTDEW